MSDYDDLRRRANLAEVIRSYGISLKQSGTKLFAHCPFHEDNTPSFSLYKNQEGIERAGCKGCDWDGDVIAFLQKIEGIDFKAAVTRLREHIGVHKIDTKPGKILATYDYTDSEGRMLYQVLRREVLNVETGEAIPGKKTFTQRRPDGNGKWVYNLTGVTRVLYRLPRLQDADTVWLVEGEKDVHSLEAAGIVATTNAGGAKARWEQQYTEALRGKHIIICGDADAPGRERDATVATALHGAAASIRMVRLPGPPLCKDVSDWLEAGQILEALLELAVPFVPPAPDPPPKVQASSNGHGDWRSLLLYNHMRNPKPCLANAIIALRHAPEWDGVLWLSEFTGGVYSRRDGRETPWRDSCDVMFADWLHHQGIMISKDVAGQAVQAVAEERKFHPVREYLDKLQWDGMPRLDNWLIKYLGVEAGHYAAAVGPRWLISAVARVMEPGCKADCCLILEGEQGIRKSTALKILAGDWFTDEMPDLGNKDSAIQAQGVWIIEISEMDAFRRSEVSRIKAFMSRTTDRFRPPYGKRSVEFPRQCIFAASTNQDTYFQDETGNRRFWPVRCGRIDIAELARVRDQLWAEAVMRYREGAAWWLDDERLIALAVAEQRKRYESDPWEGRVREYLDGRPDVTVTMVLDHCLVKPAKDWSQTDKNRVGRILRSLGYRMYRERAGDMREWRWRNPEVESLF